MESKRSAKEANMLRDGYDSDTETQGRPGPGGSDDKVEGAKVRLEYACGQQLAGVAAALLGYKCWDLAAKLLAMLDAGVAPSVSPSVFSDAGSGAVASGTPAAGIQTRMMRYKDVRSALLSLVAWRVEELYQREQLGYGKLNLASPRFRDPLQVACAFDGTEALSGVEGVWVSGQSLPGQCARVQALDALIGDLEPMLRTLGPYLGESPTLMAKLCRLFQSYILAKEPKAADADETKHTMSAAAAEAKFRPVLALIAEVFLPALTAGESNAFLSSAIWALLSLFPFEIRFACYEAWRGAGLGKSGAGSKPNIQAEAETIAFLAARGHLKRLSVETCRPIGRLLGSCSHNCPMVLHGLIISQVEAYDNLIQVIVDAMRYQTELSRDTMAYMLVTQLQKDDGKMKKGDTNYSQWFMALSRFTATFYRRYPLTEIKGMLHYLLNRLSLGESLDLLVLKDLLGIMGGCDTLLEVSQQQLDGLAGGKTLRGEVMRVQQGGAATQASVGGDRLPVRTLRDELLGSGTAMPLLLYLAQIRSKILHNTDTTHLKLISYLYDTAQDVLMQFTDFLVAGGKNVLSIAPMMPPMKSLLNDVGLSIAVAFQLVRPIVRAALHYGEDPMSAPKELRAWHPFR
jgi:hypothetical protein